MKIIRAPGREGREGGGVGGEEGRREARAASTRAEQPTATGMTGATGATGATAAAAISHRAQEKQAGECLSALPPRSRQPLPCPPTNPPRPKPPSLPPTRSLFFNQAPRGGARLGEAGDIVAPPTLATPAPFPRRFFHFLRFFHFISRDF
jgi:hypothetical protein